MKQLTILFLLCFGFIAANAQCPSFTVDTTSTPPTCIGYNDATISVLATPISGPSSFAYELYNAGGTLLDSVGVGAGSHTFSTLIAGTYYIITEHTTAGCFDTTYVTINDPMPMTFANSVADASCFGNCDGSISTFVMGGTQPITIDWYNGLNSYMGSGPMMSGLCADNYYLVATDDNGCFADIYEMLNEPAEIIVSENVTPDSGTGDGAITLTVTGGSGGYNYSWTGPNGFTATTQNITNLSSGSYAVDVIDGNGCLETQTYFVSSQVLTTNFYTIDPYCFAEPTGGISVNAIGGTGNYNFEITDLSYNLIFSSTSTLDYYNLASGQYYYIVTDLGNLQADTNFFELFDPMPITAIETITHETCGQCNGSISLNVTGGSPPYTVSWSNGSTTFGQSGLCAGTYTADIFDGNGCFATYTYTITDLGGTPFTVSSTSTNTTCAGNCDGSLTATTTGGTQPFTFQWDDPGNQIGSTAINLCDGIYSVIVTDASGCTITHTDTVNPNTTVYGTVLSTTNTSCSVCDGSVTVVGSGGVGPYTYVNVLTQDTNTTGTFNNLCANIDYVEIIDANGCSGVVTYIIDQIDLPGLNYSSVVTDESATGAYDGAIDISYDTVAYPNVTFSWIPIASSNEDLLNLTGGTYSVEIHDPNTGGCETYTETVSTLPSNGYITGYVIVDNNSDCIFNGGDSYLQNIVVNITDGTNTYTTLTNQSGYYSANLPNGTYTVTPQIPSGYTINCSASQSVTINGNVVGPINFFATAPPFEDLCSYVYGWGFVPGFDAYISAYAVNNGTIASDGEFSVVIPMGTSFVYSNQTPSSIVGDTIYYSLNNLAPGAYFQVFIQVNVPTWFQLGDMVQFCSNVELLGGGTDLNPACDEDCTYDIVVGSYDPNDKAVEPMGIDTPGYIEVDEDQFIYTIRFQNTGTAPAHNVYITDTLDAMLDPTTLQVLAQSHAMNIEFPMSNVVKFRFDNIMLPDSNANEPESHGYVQFRINTVSTPQLTETVENTANIYFDFNEPIITNTTLNTYADFSDVSESNASNELNLYPNPTENQLFHNVTTDANYQIYNLEGKLMQRGVIMPFESIDVSNLPQGMYFIEIDNATGLQRDKFTKN